ncbi:Hypothetical predicted protein [Xyrichtys novacula]|uniref:Uncharacterized protein n=1 Tax=Xyrichtys novacula TaxID=13765 RepID=A0AAV1F880_XYRNO|nr:Hypothetical predicted protein [Xyrichtys novacula]
MSLQDPEGVTTALAALLSLSWCGGLCGRTQSLLVWRAPLWISSSASPGVGDLSVAVFSLSWCGGPLCGCIQSPLL